MQKKEPKILAKFVLFIYNMKRKIDRKEEK